MDEKTKQVKEDGQFPEYKQKCRKHNVIPNHYFMRHSVDEDILMRYRYFSPGDCHAMGSEMKVIEIITLIRSNKYARKIFT